MSKEAVWLGSLLSGAIAHCWAGEGNGRPSKTPVQVHGASRVDIYVVAGNEAYNQAMKTSPAPMTHIRFSMCPGPVRKVMNRWFAEVMCSLNECPLRKCLSL